MTRSASPRLEEGEWVLLLDLYTRRRPSSVTANDPELIALSALLSRRLHRIAEPGTAWRTPDGLRARMSVFRVLDPNVGTPDTKRSEIGGAVWSKYHDNPVGLNKEATRVRTVFEAEADLFDRPGAGGRVAPSRGPTAWNGSGVFDRPDGACWVYVLALAWLHAGAPSGPPHIKVGRSNDVDQRAKDLNGAFPPDLGLAWRVVDAIRFDSTAEADEVEKRLLNDLYTLGLTQGGEFVRADPAVILERLQALA